MNRRIALPLVLVTLAFSMSGLVGCAKSNIVQQSPGETAPEGITDGVLEANSLKKMTLEDVSRFKQQKSFSWSDFSAYEGEDIGSGFFVFKYNLLGGGYLLVSGPSLEQAPQKVVYYDSAGEEDQIK